MTDEPMDGGTSSPIDGSTGASGAMSPPPENNGTSGPSSDKLKQGKTCKKCASIRLTNAGINIWVTYFENIHTTKEYPKVLSVNSFDSLNKQLCEQTICKINTLAFHVHGDEGRDRSTGGVLRLKNIDSDSDGTVLEKQNFSVYRENLEKLNEFLVSDAKVIFFSCGTGNGERGDNFLTELSNIWKGRTVIAFTTFLFQQTGVAINSAGDILDTKEFSKLCADDIAHKNLSTLKKASLNSDTSKWAKDGKIIRAAKLDGAKSEKKIIVPPCQKEKGKEKFPDVCKKWKEARKDILFRRRMQLNAIERNDKKSEDEWTYLLEKYINDIWRGQKTKLEEANKITFSEPILPKKVKDCDLELRRLGFDIKIFKKKTNK
jgi:hypothetical protein